MQRWRWSCSTQLMVHPSTIGASSAWGKINGGRHRRGHRNRRVNQFPVISRPGLVLCATSDPSVFLTLQNQLAPEQKWRFRQATPIHAAQTFPAAHARRCSVNEGLPMALVDYLSENRKIKALPALHSVPNPHKMPNPHTMAQNLRYPGRVRPAGNPMTMGKLVKCGSFDFNHQAHGIPRPAAVHIEREVRIPRMSTHSSCSYTQMDVSLSATPQSLKQEDWYTPRYTAPAEPPARITDGEKVHVRELETVLTGAKPMPRNLVPI